MKKYLLASALCLSIVYMNAQPTLLSSEMLQVGSSMHHRAITNLGVIDTTIQGANKTWNFSTIHDSIGPSADMISTLVNKSSTPYAGNFPSSNYVFFETKGTSTAYRYFNLTSSKLERVGSGSSSGITTYSDPQVEYIFPTTLGSSNNDTWASDASSFGGNYNIKCIGYGTLMLPSTTYNNALLVRVNFNEGNFITLTIYFWYSSDNGAILMEYIHGDGFFVPEQCVYLQSLTVAGVAEHELAYNLKYNNPVEDHLTMSFSVKKPGALNYIIVNALGQTVVPGNTMYIYEEAKLDVDLSNLPKGIYYLMLQREDLSAEPQTIKLLKL